MDSGRFGGVRTPKPINIPFGEYDYVDKLTPRAKIQNDRPTGDIAEYAW